MAWNSLNQDSVRQRFNMVYLAFKTVQKVWKQFLANSGNLTQYRRRRIRDLAKPQIRFNILHPNLRRQGDFPGRVPILKLISYFFCMKLYLCMCRHVPKSKSHKFSIKWSQVLMDMFYQDDVPFIEDEGEFLFFCSFIKKQTNVTCTQSITLFLWPFISWAITMLTWPKQSISFL